MDGDEASISWIVTHFSPLLKAQARMRLGNNSIPLCDPEDLVQDVWGIALRKLQNFEPVGPRYTAALVAYLSRILLNQYRTRLRRQILEVDQKENLRVAQDQAEQQRGNLTSYQGLVSAAIRSEQSECITRAIESLSPGDQRVVILRGIEMVPNREVAEQLNMLPNTVAARYIRALVKLRSILPGSIFLEFQED